MKSYCGSAPGKVLLWGEYGVLKGAPALVMAINRRVQVSLSPAQGFALTAIPAGNYEAAVRHQLATLLDQHRIDPQQLEQLALTIDSSALFQSNAASPRKLGLGSSAAVLAALDAAVGALRGNNVNAAVRGDSDGVQAPAARLAALQALHQSGQGSGVDLAAAMYGGVLSYQRVVDGKIKCQPMTWPNGLHWAVLWSGQPSSSADHVTRFLHWCDADPNLAEAWIGRCAQSSQDALTALAAGDLQAVLEAFDEAAELMGTIGDRLGAALLTPVDIKCRKIAQRFDLIYKPSGAGGGDIGLLLGQEAEAVAAAVKAMQELGLQRLDLAIEHKGATGRTHADLSEVGEQGR